MTASYSELLAAQLAAVAAAAMISPAAAPQGWTPLVTFQGDGSASLPEPNGQGMYLTGIDHGSGDPIAVLALGAPWQLFVSQYNPIPPNNPQKQVTKLGQLAQVTGARIDVPAPVAAAGQGGQFTSLYVAVYSQLWTPLWNNLAKFRSSIDPHQLYVVGLGPGAALALLATLDLRSGRQAGPGGKIDPPAQQPVAYVFSAAPVADAAFQSFYAQNAGTTFSVNAATASTTVDFFPTAPGSAQGYVLPGTLQGIAAPLPPVSDPWQERSGGAYAAALGAADQAAPSHPVAPSHPAAPAAGAPPAGYDAVTAYSLALLCGVANAQRQHPTATGEVPLGPYTLGANVGAGGVPWCSIFSSPSGPVAAFRDTVTWDELISLQMPNLQTQAPFLSLSAGLAQTSLVTLYTALRAELASRLTAQAGGAAVTFTGYGFGGALASLTAFDLARNPSAFGNLALAGLYTFGASRLGDTNFVTAFADALGPRSYQVARPADFLPNALSAVLYSPLPQPVPLLGAPPDDDRATGHTLASYLELLDPYVA